MSDALNPLADDASEEERQRALAAALRGQQTLGMLAQLEIPTLANFGQSLAGSAQHGMQQQEAARQRKLQLGLENKKDAEMQQYRQDSLKQRHEDLVMQDATRRLQAQSIAEQRAAGAEARKAAAEDRKAAADEKLGLRKQTLISGLSSKMLGNLDEGAFGGPLKAQVETKFRSEHLLKLAEKAKNAGFNNLTAAEQEGLALGFGQMVAGGKPTAGQTAALIPPETLQAGAQGIKEWFLNEPLGRNQTKFTERTVHSIKRQRDVAQAIIDREKAQRLGAHRTLRELDPVQWEANVINAHMDPALLDEKGVYHLPEPPPEEGTMVDVVNESGVPGQVPAEKLEAALKKGYRRAP